MALTARPGTSHARALVILGAVLLVTAACDSGGGSTAARPSSTTTTDGRPAVDGALALG